MNRLRLPRIPASFLFVVCLLFPVVSFAQSNAKIHGTVTDPSGSAIAGAAVNAQPLNASTSIAEVRSAANGEFSLAVPAGTYRVTVSAVDFAASERNVSVAAGVSEVFDARLQLAPLSSNVIVTAAALATSADNAISPVDVIDRTQIDNKQEIWLAPLLASVPGITLSRLGPMGGVTSLFLDGGNFNYARVLMDGVPADVSLPGLSVDLSNYTADSVDKIEVVHGASSALYGSDAMAGVVQVFTHRGTTRTPQLVLDGEGGTFDTGRGSGQLSGLVGRFDYSVGGGYFSSGGQGSGDYFRDTTLTGNFGFKFSDTDNLRLTLRNNTSDAGQPGQTLLASESPFAVSPGEHSGLHDFSSGLTWNFMSGEHWQNRVQAYESRFQDTIALPEFDFTAIDKFNRAGIDARSSYLFHNGAITTGYAFESETGGALGRHDEAGYLEARYQFGRRFTAVAGGRVEANDSYGTRFVPRVGASYALRYGSGFWGATRLRASYGEGIKEPPLFPDGCTPILKPEQSSTFDAGFDQFLDSDRIRFSATYFHNDFRDIVSFESTNNMPSCPAFGGTYFNTDKARAFGANSSFEVRAKRWLSVAGSYSYDDSKVLKAPNANDPALFAGNRLFKRPLHSANLSLNAHFQRVNWSLTGFYVGRRTDSDFLGLGITSNSSYVRWDMAMMVPLRYGLSATAHFENLFDRHYQDAIGYPALGYNYRVGLRYVWGGEK